MIAITIDDLAELLEAVAKPLSFGEAMTAIGYETVLGALPKKQ